MNVWYKPRLQSVDNIDQADIRRIRAQEQRVRGQQVLMEMENEDNDAGVGDVHPQAGAAE